MTLLKVALGYVASSYVKDRVVRPRSMGQLARKAADRRGKPLLFIHDNGVMHHLMGCPVRAEAQTGTAYPLRAPNKFFGAVLAVGVLERAKRPAVVLREWHRVADAVFVVVPSWWSPHAWIDPSVRWLIDPGLTRASPLWTNQQRSCLLDVSDSRYGTQRCAPTKTKTFPSRPSPNLPQTSPTRETMASTTMMEAMTTPPGSPWSQEQAPIEMEELEESDFPSLAPANAQSEGSVASPPFDSWSYAKDIMVISSEEFDES